MNQFKSPLGNVESVSGFYGSKETTRLVHKMPLLVSGRLIEYLEGCPQNL